MEFKISRELLAKKRWGALIILAYLVALLLLISLLFDYNGLSWSSLLIVFGLTAVLTVGFNYADYRKLYKYSLHHKIYVSDEGLQFFEGDMESLLKWDKVSDIFVKRGRSGIKKLHLVTSLTGKVDLSRYEKLEQLYELVKKFVKERKRETMTHE